MVVRTKLPEFCEKPATKTKKWQPPETVTMLVNPAQPGASSLPVTHSRSPSQLESCKVSRIVIL